MKFKDDIQGGGGGKDFLKLKDGESVVGIFRGEPHDFRQHWKAGRSVICMGDTCPVCKEGHRSTFRFRLNIILNENGAWTAKIFENGWGTYEYLKKLHNADYNLERTIVQISRSGTGTDTTYNILPLPGKKGEVPDDYHAELSKVKLHDLVGLVAVPSWANASQNEHDFFSSRRASRPINGH